MKIKSLIKGTSLVYIGLLMLTSACALLGINANWKTPAKAGKYPVFSEKDSLRGFTNRYRACYDVSFYPKSSSYLFR